MKKSIFALAALAALALTACQKEEQATFLKSFKASTERYTQQGTKTELSPDGHNIYWQDGDVVVARGNIDGGYRSGGYLVAPNASNPTIADMEWISGFEFASLDDVDNIIYPASILDGPFIVFPREQQSVTDGIAGLPMYGIHTGDDETVRFYHMFGLLKLNLTKVAVTVDHISITTDKAINGKLNTDLESEILAIDGQQIRYPIAEWSASDVDAFTTTLQLSTPQDISTATDFYIGIPQGDFEEFVIRIYTTDGRVAPMAATSTIRIERAKITSVTAGSSLDFRDED